MIKLNKIKNHPIVFSCITFIIIMLLIIIYLINIDGTRKLLYINWKVKISEPVENFQVFQYDFRKGADFNILQYKHNSLAKITTSNPFKKINKDNIEIVKNILVQYKELLSEEDLHLFLKEIDMEKLIKKDQYYLYRRVTNREFLLMITDSNHKLYVFSANF